MLLWVCACILMYLCVSASKDSRNLGVHSREKEHEPHVKVGTGGN